MNNNFLKTIKKIKRDGILYLILLPTIVFFIVFHIWPILGMKLAFYDYKIKGDNIFVGIKYFRQLFSTPAFWKIMQNTLVISGMKIFLFFPLPVFMAIFLNEVRSGPFRKGVQIISYLPHFLSWVVIAGVWFQFLSPEAGLVNQVIRFFGGTPIDFLTDKGSIRWVLFFSESWRSIGWDSIIFLTAILSIDFSLYEAGTIDGASRLQLMRHITLPALVAPMITMLILNIGFFMNAGLDQILNFSNDAVLSKIDIIDTYVYRIGILNSQYSLATAANLFKAFIGVFLIISTHFTAKRITGKGAW